METESDMNLPFIYGAHYYRAPIPDKSLWAEDLRRMSDSGFNAVKYFALWRWIHRKPDMYVLEDLDELMDLAAENNLSVTINVLFDVAPVWIFKEYPDCLMVTSAGMQLQPRASRSRQVGGYPGPCLNHPESAEARWEFLRNLAVHYADHPAMGMWDIWNEPESCDYLRLPQSSTLLCYCDNCRQNFISWLQVRYQDIGKLNDVWGRCYLDWDEIELPRDPSTYSDMIDWRLFNGASLAAEAERRIEIVKSVDTRHPVYLHPVPNTLEHLNSVTGVDDFQITKGCDCVGGTTNGIISTIQCVSVAEGRVAYNVESHLRCGASAMYPRHLTAKDIAYEFLPQIGQGIKGFIYWQYRCETLGGESPAWGLLDVDGSPGATHASAVEFWRRLQPVTDRLMDAAPEPAEVAIFRSSENEIFHWCMHENLEELRMGLHAYTRILLKKNVRLIYVDEKSLIKGLSPGIKLLVMPNAYALSRPAADSLAEWISHGGVVICEAHTGGFDLTRGRHSTTMPGLGIAEAFGLYERNVTAVPHLGVSEAVKSLGDGSADLAKAIDAFGIAGGNILPLDMVNGDRLIGWSRYAELEGDMLEPIAALPGHLPCVASRKVGSGAVYYIGTLAGRMWTELGSPGLEALVDRAIQAAGIPLSTERWPGVMEGVRVDTLKAGDDNAIVITNSTDNRVEFYLDCTERLLGIFTGQLEPGNGPGSISLGARQAELFVSEKWTNNDNQKRIGRK